MMPEVIWR